MKLESVHIILIGFKHVGKSAIGKALAQHLGKPFLDLDESIESLFHAQYQDKKTCREIMQLKGELFFRHLEHQALKQAIALKPAVISLGGGAAVHAQNHELLHSHIVVHIKAPQGVVFERIMINGRPAFFSPDENPFESFLQLWEKRETIYQALTHLSIDNNHSIEQAVSDTMALLEEYS